MDVCVGLSMHFLYEKNGIWVTPQSNLHLSLALLKITLVITNKKWLQTPYVNLILWGEFRQDLVGVSRSVHVCAVTYVHKKCFTPDICLSLMCDKSLLCFFCQFWCLTLHTYLACLIIALKCALVLAHCCSYVQSNTSEQYGSWHACWHACIKWQHFTQVLN